MNKQKLREEKEKLKNMKNFNERFTYITAYYRIPIIIGVVILFLMYQAGSIIFRGAQDTMLYFGSINQPGITSQSVKILEEEFYELEGFSGWKQVLSFETGMDFEDESLSTASTIKFQSYLSTDTLDVLVTTEEFLYENSNIFINLKSILPVEMQSSLSSYFLYTENSSGDLIPIGISLNESSLAKKVELSNDAVLAVCSINHHPEVVLDFISYCFDQ